MREEEVIRAGKVHKGGWSGIWWRTYSWNLEQIPGLWRPNSAFTSVEILSLMHRILATILLVARTASFINLCGWFQDNIQRRLAAEEVYVLLWVTIEVVLLRIAPLSTRINSWLGLLIIYRMSDIAVWHGATVVVDSIRFRFDFTSIRRTLILLVSNVAEYILCFGWLYLHSHGVWNSGEMLGSAKSAVYFSLTTFLTVGYGDWTPRMEPARQIFFAQASVMIAILFVVLPLYIALLIRDLGQVGGRET